MSSWSNNSKAYAMLSGTSIMWGGSMVAGKMAVTVLAPFSVGFLRFALTSTVFLLYFFWREKGLVIPARADWPIIVLLGLVGVFGANATFLVGVRYSTAINAGLINAGAPIVISILSVLFLKEHIRPIQVLGIISALLGVGIVITKGAWANLVSIGLNIGDLILLLNPLFLGIYAVLAKKLMDRHGALALAAYTSIIGAVSFFPFFIYECVLNNAAVQVTVSGWIAIGYLGLLATTLGAFWWNRGIDLVGANRSGIFINGIPVVAMFLSFFLLGEKILVANMIGTILVITGVYFNSSGQVRALSGNVKYEKGKIDMC